MVIIRNSTKAALVRVTYLGRFLTVMDRSALQSHALPFGYRPITYDEASRCNADWMLEPCLGCQLDQEV